MAACTAKEKKLSICVFQFPLTRHKHRQTVQGLCLEKEWSQFIFGSCLKLEIHQLPPVAIKIRF
jgi:hypothetical protein